MLSNNTLLQVSNVKKTFGEVIALNGVTFDIMPGEVVGLVGSNGAGKTTTINILTGLVTKDSGSTNIFGQDTISNYRFTRSQIGISAQEFA